MMNFQRSSWLIAVEIDMFRYVEKITHVLFNPVLFLFYFYTCSIACFFQRPYQMNNLKIFDDNCHQHGQRVKVLYFSRRKISLGKKYLFILSRIVILLLNRGWQLDRSSVHLLLILDILGDVTYFKILQNILSYFSMYFRIFTDTSGYFKILQVTTGYFKLLQDISRYIKLLQNTSSYFKIFQVPLGYFRIF